jgi:hypothetical protein
MEEIVYSNIQAKMCCWVLTFDSAPLFDTSGCVVSGFHRVSPSDPYLYWNVAQQCFTNQTDAENTRSSLNAGAQAQCPGIGTGGWVEPGPDTCP